MNLPSDPKAELFTAALILDDPKVLNSYPWDEAMFVNLIAKSTYLSVVRLTEKGYEVNAMSVAVDAEKSGDLKGIESGQNKVLANATDGMGMSGGIEFYFNVLSELWTRRKAIISTMEGLSDLKKGSKTPQEVSDEIAISCKSLEVKVQPNLKDQLGEMLKLIEANKTRERFPTGMEQLDFALDGGYERGELLVYAGETSMGKSVLLQMAAAALGVSGRSVTIYTLEMSAATILTRLSANLANKAIMFRGESDEGYIRAITKAVNQIGQMKLTIRDNIFSLSEIMRDAKIQIENGADAIIIDYIQRVEHYTKENREQAVAEVTRQMKRLALQGNVAVLSASQLNEDGKVRESRAISQDCDILAVIKDGFLCLDKFRRGERFRKIGCKLNGALARFDYVKYEPEEEKPKYKKR